jgi:hypothetical protein
MSGTMKHATSDGPVTPRIEDTDHENMKLSKVKESFVCTRTVLLDVWMEVLGFLSRVDVDRGLLYFQGLIVLVPPRELLTLLDIDRFIGRKVRLLRTDLLNKPLCILCEASTHQRQHNTVPENRPNMEYPGGQQIWEGSK